MKELKVGQDTDHATWEKKKKLLTTDTFFKPVFSLQVYENGTNENETIVFFNLKDASKGIGKDRTLMLQRVSISAESLQAIVIDF